MSNSSKPEKPIHRQGLSASEVEESRQKHGSNRPTPPVREPWWKLYLEKYNDPVVRILLVAAIMAIGLGFIEGSIVEGIGIVIAILLATSLSFVNEFRANREFDVLNQINESVPVQVIREGCYTSVPRHELVVGDVVLVEQGDEIPADGDALEVSSLLIDESRLTGESVPVSKHPHQEEEKKKDETYPSHTLLQGTLVSDGHGVIEVTAVGDRTEMGQTAQVVLEEETEESPLNIQLARLSKLLGVVGFSVAFLLFAALTTRGYWRNELSMSATQWLLLAGIGMGALLVLVRIWLPIAYDALELLGRPTEQPQWLKATGAWPWIKTILLGVVVAGAIIVGLLVSGRLSGPPASWIPLPVGKEFLQYFMISVTIIVVSIPEGLAMSVTLSLAYSMRKMIQMNNLVRRMVACETVGATTVICSDKTGTLTQNKMRVENVAFSCHTADLTESTPPSDFVVEAISANSTANLSLATEGETTVIGNPTESALLLWLSDHEFDYLSVRESFAIKRQYTFSTERKYMATLGQSSVVEGSVLHVKGAPEILLERSSAIATKEGERELPSQEKEDIANQILAYARRGMRTLGFAYRKDINNSPDDPEEICRELVWLGFVALIDPIRPDAKDAVQACLQAGIQVKIVTGDNAETAKDVARNIGLLSDNNTTDQHLTGPDFEALSDEQAEQACRSLVVLSRARPMHKLRLVRLLQKQGHVVAVTGDGSNDAPALHHAQVGLAMGTGTAVAKEASDIILLDNSFRSISNAVLWGRSLYLNIQRFILFQLTINLTALSIALLGPFLNVKLPLTVMQMLWVNLIMDTFAALALATEPPHSSVMEKPPRSADAFIITPTMTKNIVVTGGIFVVLLLSLLLWLQQGGLTSYELSFFFSAFVLLQFWNLFNARAFGTGRSAFVTLTQNPSFLSISAAIIIGQILIVHWGGSVFRTVPLSVKDWALLFLASSTVLLVGELMRWKESKHLKAA